MSYDIYFVKTHAVNSENIEEILESDALENDSHFIAKGLMREIKAELVGEGLRFETFEGKDDDYLELNFETYQIAISSSQVAVSLPFWDANNSGAIGSQIKTVSRVLIERGFTGYDPQAHKFFNEATPLTTDFGRVNEEISEHFPREETREKRSEGWRLIRFGIMFFLVAFVIRTLVSLFS